MSFVTQVSKRNEPFTDVNELRANIIGLASAGFMMAFFGSAWWGWGIGGIQGAFLGENVLFFVILALITIILLSGGALLLLSVRRLPQDLLPSDKSRGAVEGKSVGMAYGLIFGIEILTIALCSMLLYRFHHPEFLMPFVSIIVGIHFLPLAKLFYMRLYYFIGILLVLVSVTVMLAVPVNTMLGNLQMWNALVGSITAVILWLTGIYAELRGRNFLKQAQELLKAE